MAGSVKPVRSESVRFLVGGVRKGQGVVLLYPDKLAKVSVYAEMWGYFVGPLIVAAAAYPIVRHVGSFPESISALQAALGVGLGGAIGRAVDRGLAARQVAEAPQGATIIPLDQITSLQTFRPTRLGSLFRAETLVVTTADGTEYGFRVRGRSSALQVGIATALAGLGREVRATPLGLAVTPRAVDSGA